MALVDIGQFVLITRSTLVDVLTEDFITTAKAKGVSRRGVVWKHGLRNALLPIVTASALLALALAIGNATERRLAAQEALTRGSYPVAASDWLAAQLV